MGEATKNSIKTLAIMAGSFGLFVLFATVIPDGSLAKNISAGVCVVVLVGSAIWLTPLGNPIKKLIRKWKGLE